ncbi:MAG: iron ABC transporter permease [Bradyrhizobiaceae bacterium]|nr:iron ABC transporter permease [Hyphomicrobiales bacterium]MBV9428222.1 iron ABC transporter permease [Bradyrhizobiaceae bacterium]
MTIIATTAIFDSTRQRLEPQWIVIGVCIALVVWLALVPLAFLLWQSFLTPQTAAEPARFTLENYAAAYASGETARLLGNSLTFAVGAAALSFVLGTAFAWINERTNTAFKSLFLALALVPLVIPSVLFTVAWIFLASPKIGIVNLVLQSWTGSDAAFVDIYSLGGMIWVDGLHYSPMAFLLMTAAFRSMDPALEEAALMSGAGLLQVARRITFRLAWPAAVAALLILFVRAIESFEVPALLGLPAGIEVYTSAIYQAVNKYPSEVGLASAYAVVLLLITALCVYTQSRLSRHDTRFATVTGKGFRSRRVDIGRWRYLTAALFVLYFAVLVLLPFLVLLWSSLQKFYSVPSRAALATVGLDAYRNLLDHPGFAASVLNSALLSLGSATFVMLVTSVICWIVVRTRMPGRLLLDSLTSLPLAIPGLVLGLAVMVCYLKLDVGVYDTLWIMFIAYVTRFMPYGLRPTTTSMLQIHKELEESAAMSGASWATTFRRIVLPLIKPGLIAGWIYVVIVAVRELSSSILLYSPGTEVISITIWELWQNGQYVELSAAGVMLMSVLFCLVMLAQVAGRKFAIIEP